MKLKKLTITVEPWEHSDTIVDLKLVAVHEGIAKPKVAHHRLSVPADDFTAKFDTCFAIAQQQIRANLEVIAGLRKGGQ